MHVLDLATGRGEPAQRAARRVRPEGTVLGVEPVEPLAAMTREKADRDGVRNLLVRTARAERVEDLPEGRFHVATSRWGLMYMDAPVTALTHARRALAPGGTLVAALWAEPERVPHYTLPRRILERHRPLPAIDPGAPGTFRYADPRRIERDFRDAGLVVDHVEEWDIPVFEADTGSACARAEA